MANFIINKKEYTVLSNMASDVFDAAFTATPCNHNICRKAVEFQSKLFHLEWDNMVAPDDRAIDENELSSEGLNIRTQLKAALAYYNFMGLEAICG